MKNDHSPAVQPAPHRERNPILPPRFEVFVQGAKYVAYKISKPLYYI
jgi:hypothetical protein